MSQVLILGRGESLKRLKEIITIKDKFEYIILVNSFWDTPQSEKPYYKDKLIHSFIKDKKIILVITQGCNITYIDSFLKKYNVIYCFKTNFSRYKRIGKPGRISKLGRIFFLMPEQVLQKYIEIDNKKIKEQGDVIPGSISYALLLATEFLNSREIFIFGQDFYEKDYYIKQFHNYEIEKSKIEIQKFKVNLQNFLNYLSHCKFYIYTMADYKSTSSNIIIF